MTEKENVIDPTHQLWRLFEIGNPETITSFVLANADTISSQKSELPMPENLSVVLNQIILTLQTPTSLTFVEKLLDITHRVVEIDQCRHHFQENGGLEALLRILTLEETSLPLLAHLGYFLETLVDTENTIAHFIQIGGVTALLKHLSSFPRVNAPESILAEEILIHQQTICDRISTWIKIYPDTVLQLNDDRQIQAVVELMKTLCDSLDETAFEETDEDTVEETKADISEEARQELMRQSLRAESEARRRQTRRTKTLDATINDDEHHSDEIKPQDFFVEAQLDVVDPIIPDETGGEEKQAVDSRKTITQKTIKMKMELIEQLLDILNDVAFDARTRPNLTKNATFMSLISVPPPPPSDPSPTKEPNVPTPTSPAAPPQSNEHSHPLKLSKPQFGILVTNPSFLFRLRYNERKRRIDVLNRRITRGGEGGCPEASQTLLELAFFSELDLATPEKELVQLSIVTLFDGLVKLCKSAEVVSTLLSHPFLVYLTTHFLHSLVESPLSRSSSVLSLSQSIPKVPHLLRLPQSCQSLFIAPLMLLSNLSTTTASRRLVATANTLSICTDLFKSWHDTSKTSKKRAKTDSQGPSQEELKMALNDVIEAVVLVSLLSIDKIVCQMIAEEGLLGFISQRPLKAFSKTEQALNLSPFQLHRFIFAVALVMNNMSSNEECLDFFTPESVIDIFSFLFDSDQEKLRDVLSSSTLLKFPIAKNDDEAQKENEQPSTNDQPSTNPLGFTERNLICLFVEMLLQVLSRDQDEMGNVLVSQGVVDKSLAMVVKWMEEHQPNGRKSTPVDPLSSPAIESSPETASEPTAEKQPEIEQIEQISTDSQDSSADVVNPPTTPPPPQPPLIPTASVLHLLQSLVKLTDSFPPSLLELLIQLASTTLSAQNAQNTQMTFNLIKRVMEAQSGIRGEDDERTMKECLEKMEDWLAQLVSELKTKQSESKSGDDETRTTQSVQVHLTLVCSLLSAMDTTEKKSVTAKLNQGETDCTDSVVRESTEQVIVELLKCLQTEVDKLQKPEAKKEEAAEIKVDGLAPLSIPDIDSEDDEDEKEKEEDEDDEDGDGEEKEKTELDETLSTLILLSLSILTRHCQYTKSSFISTTTSLEVVKGLCSSLFTLFTQPHPTYLIPSSAFLLSAFFFFIHALSISFPSSPLLPLLPSFFHSILIPTLSLVWVSDPNSKTRVPSNSVSASHTFFVTLLHSAAVVVNCEKVDGRQFLESEEGNNPSDTSLFIRLTTALHSSHTQSPQLTLALLLFLNNLSSSLRQHNSQELLSPLHPSSVRQITSQVAQIPVSPRLSQKQAQHFSGANNTLTQIASIPTSLPSTLEKILTSLTLPQATKMFCLRLIQSLALETTLNLLFASSSLTSILLMLLKSEHDNKGRKDTEWIHSLFLTLGSVLGRAERLPETTLATFESSDKQTPSTLSANTPSTVDSDAVVLPSLSSYSALKSRLVDKDALRVIAALSTTHLQTHRHISAVGICLLKELLETSLADSEKKDETVRQFLDCAVMMVGIAGKIFDEWGREDWGTATQNETKGQSQNQPPLSPISPRSPRSPRGGRVDQSGASALSKQTLSLFTLHQVFSFLLSFCSHPTAPSLLESKGKQTTGNSPVKTLLGGLSGILARKEVGEAMFTRPQRKESAMEGIEPESEQDGPDNFPTISPAFFYTANKDTDTSVPHFGILCLHHVLSLLRGMAGERAVAIQMMDGFFSSSSANSTTPTNQTSVSFPTLFASLSPLLASFCPPLIFFPIQTLTTLFTTPHNDKTQVREFSSRCYEQFVKDGGLEVVAIALKGLLEKGEDNDDYKFDSETINKLLSFIGSSTRTSEGKRAVIKTDIGESLVGLLRREELDEKMGVMTVRVLASAAVDAEVNERILLIGKNTLPTHTPKTEPNNESTETESNAVLSAILAFLAQYPRSEPVLSSCLSAFSTFAADTSNCLLLLSSGSIRTAISSCKQMGQNEKVADSSSLFLNNVSRVLECGEEIGRHGGIQLIESLLTQKSNFESRVARRACGAIVSLAANEKVNMVLSTSVIPERLVNILVDMMLGEGQKGNNPQQIQEQRQKDSDLVETILKACVNLVANEHSAMKMLQAGLIEGIEAVMVAYINHCGTVDYEELLCEKALKEEDKDDEDERWVEIRTNLKKKLKTHTNLSFPLSLPTVASAVSVCNKLSTKGNSPIILDSQIIPLLLLASNHSADLMVCADDLLNEDGQKQTTRIENEKQKIFHVLAGCVTCVTRLAALPTTTLVLASLNLIGAIVHLTDTLALCEDGSFAPSDDISLDQDRPTSTGDILMKEVLTLRLFVDGVVSGKGVFSEQELNQAKADFGAQKSELMGFLNDVMQGKISCGVERLMREEIKEERGGKEETVNKWARVQDDVRFILKRLTTQ
ncbi:hypothetical protein BLNAU_9961 [Blattamonas nauphoetae]|uniref:Uncharacterized protein n=1 Tax=Blattamonas nauphoetae TaxID=2049346 RepID=A0ABQ9XU67_9EUKA|nr:hypothetical protein BLNAU_9961 [Blattamonas nauphoetae]